MTYRRIFYKSLEAVLTPLFRWMYEIEIEGTENLPAGGAIVAPNHSSYLDPIVINSILCNKISLLTRNFSTGNASFLSRFVDDALRNMGHIFLRKNRRISREGLEKALDILRRGHYLGVFPEGQRSRDNRLGEFRDGAAYISAESGKPIVPTKISGTYEIFPRHRKIPGIFGRIKVVFGKPIYPAKERNKDSITRTTEILRQEIQNLS